MNSRHLLSGFLPLVLSCMTSAAIAQSPPAESAKFRQLDVSAGHWVYHGHSIAAHGARPSAWTWDEHCRWSANRMFMLCSFSNTWGGRHVNSVVVDTYNPQSDSFWHYEIFNSGRSAAKPFASRMQIDGATRIESWTETRKGKPVQQRIVYKFASGDKVAVQFQQSKDGTHWETTAAGTGEKSAASAGQADPQAQAPGNSG